MPTFCETLESRTFLSASPVHKAAPTPTQVADLAALTAAQTTLASDRGARVTTLAADRAAIPADRERDQLVITGDIVQIRSDRGDPSKVLADELQLRTDRATLRLDIHEATVTLASDNIGTFRQILTDIRAVTAARLKYLRDVRLGL
jgi:hypothetical protein